MNQSAAGRRGRVAASYTTQAAASDVPKAASAAQPKYIARAGVGPSGTDAGPPARSSTTALRIPAAMTAAAAGPRRPLVVGFVLHCVTLYPELHSLQLQGELLVTLET